MTTPTGPYFPTNELVAVAWLSQRVAGLTSSMVATSLPKDTSTWADEGFLQVQAIPGGTPDIDTFLRRPVFQLDGWACSPSSAKPPWNLANRLLELVRVATEDAQAGHYGKAVTLPDSYGAARVQSAYLIGEPRRILDDEAGYARFTVDLAIDWVRA